ncbi:unnamed protein product [Acanthoscelides obtectus]|uniref:Uncharacterized protein n=1 Tax=Acanthoscelides obtectus TaxID=200917 RepID=A0A9P0P445_ACAOB|nr:unnamed protein product [Acanthoscelides obtectus]CAK1622888.1 hypothetical protein AOBTE_LOCUS1710 [Acanthoscelides obtectus]
MFAEATILDPRFKKFGFDSKTAFECAKQNLISYVTRNTSSSSEVTNRNDEQIQADGVELTKRLQNQLYGNLLIRLLLMWCLVLIL